MEMILGSNKRFWKRKKKKEKTKNSNKKIRALFDKLVTY